MIYMKKKTVSIFRKTMAAAAALSICCASGIPAYAGTDTSVSGIAESDQSGLEAALAKVKERITVPEKYSDFSYTKNTSSAVDSFSFTWKTDSEISSDVNSYITVRISGDKIIGYEKYDSSYNEYPGKPSFGRLSDTQLLKAAEKALKVFDPQLAGKVKFESDMDRYLSSTSVTVNFHRVNEDVGFERNSGSVTLDKDTGEVLRFDLTWWDDAKFKKVSSAVSEDRIEKAYTENVSLIPSYRISEGKDNAKTAAVVYSPDDDVVFDADLAKPTSMYDDYKAAQNTDNYSLESTFGRADMKYAADDEAAPMEENAVTGSGISKGGKIVFTDAEKNALIESGKYYSKSDILEVLKNDKYLGLDNSYVLNYAEFTKTQNDSVPSGYAWNMSFYVNTSDTYKSIDVTADAESGKIVSFYRYNSKEPSKTINIKKVNKIAEAAAKYYLPELIGEFESASSNYDAAEKAVSRDIVFNRMHEGIRVSGNDIRINVNSDGEVMSFSYSYDKTDFDSPDIISADEAFEKLFEQTDFELSYDGFLTLDGKAKTYLLYSLDSYNLNAKTGSLCDYYGREITAENVGSGCPYTDIAGTSSEKYIRKLYDYGITLPDAETEFRPNDVITEKEFAYLLEQINYSGILYELYGSYAYDPTSKVGTNKLTKLGAARLFVISAGGKNFAELKGIYKSPFADVNSSNDNIGYISMAYAMGAAKADAKGNFNPDGKVTRGYAMYLICSYIEHNGK